LPVQQAIKFEFAINLKRRERSASRYPPSVLATVDGVIE
jgi:hypothetical protein